MVAVAATVNGGGGCKHDTNGAIMVTMLTKDKKEIKDEKNN